MSVIGTIVNVVISETIVEGPITTVRETAVLGRLLAITNQTSTSTTDIDYEGARTETDTEIHYAFDGGVVAVQPEGATVKFYKEED